MIIIVVLCSVFFSGIRLSRVLQHAPSRRSVISIRLHVLPLPRVPARDYSGSKAGVRKRQAYLGKSVDNNVPANHELSLIVCPL